MFVGEVCHSGEVTGAQVALGYGDRRMRKLAGHTMCLVRKEGEGVNAAQLSSFDLIQDCSLKDVPTHTWHRSSLFG